MKQERKEELKIITDYLIDEYERLMLDWVGNKKEKDETRQEINSIKEKIEYLLNN